MKLIAGTWAKDKFAFGASLLRGSHPKKKRTFVRKLPMHVIIKSSEARGAKSMLANAKRVERIVEEQAERHSVKLHSGANAGNHLHILLEAPSLDHLSRFLRAITGRISQLLSVRWDARPFSRVVSWGRDFKNMLRYLGINTLETLRMPREAVRAMHAKIEAAVKSGVLQRSPGLIAAGFA